MEEVKKIIESFKISDKNFIINKKQFLSMFNEESIKNEIYKKDLELALENNYNYTLEDAKNYINNSVLSFDKLKDIYKINEEVLSLCIEKLKICKKDGLDRYDKEVKKCINSIEKCIVLDNVSKEIKLEFLKINHTTFKLFNKDLITNQDFIYKAIKNNGSVILLNKKFQENENLIYEAVRNKKYIYSCLIRENSINKKKNKIIENKTFEDFLIYIKKKRNCEKILNKTNTILSEKEKKEDLINNFVKIKKI